jgi:hypothetical protein
MNTGRCLFFCAGVPIIQPEVERWRLWITVLILTEILHDKIFFEDINIDEGARR